MRILLYNPDNGVTRNFMPHLWMFLLKALTPPGHEVVLVDGNAKPMNERQLVRFVREQGIGLVGIGAMTRMIAKAYRMGDAIRAAGVPVVMGGPHVTELPDEALGRDGGPRHADAVALGEADETWPRIVEDAARGQLKDIYEPVDETGKERKPSLQPYPVIPWDKIDLDQFNVIPKVFQRFTEPHGSGWKYFNMMPVESGRGCPYGCEFCTVTGFFGDSIRFRTNESVVNELLMLKRRARKERGQVAVFFIDDNFAINIKRTKSLLRDIIAAKAQLPWTAQISANLLRDEELVDLIAEAGGKWIFIGMESIDEVNLADVTPGVAERTMQQIKQWPPGMPVFGPLTPLPGTPLYARLGAEGRLTRPKHWLNFDLYRMAHTPLKMTIPEAQIELDKAWRTSYSPERNEEVIDLLSGRGLDARLMHFVMRLLFRGIYIPQMNKRTWVKLIAQNRRPIIKLVKQSVGKYREARKNRSNATPLARPV